MVLLPWRYINRKGWNPLTQMRCKWRAGASTLGIQVRNGNWLRKFLKIFIQELPSECLLRDRKREEAEGYVFPPLLVLRTPRPWNQGSFLKRFSMFSCASGKLYSSIFVERGTLYISAKGVSFLTLLDDSVRLLGLMGTACLFMWTFFIKCIDHHDLWILINYRLLIYVWDVKKSLMHGRKRDF